MTMFVKKFGKLEDGFRELKQLSFSVADATGDAMTIEAATATLATNTLFPQTGNGVGWDLPKLQADPFGLAYTTCGGLHFGWRALFNGPVGSANTDHVGYEFFIRHPEGIAPVDSTLRASAQVHGWTEGELQARFCIDAE